MSSHEESAQGGALPGSFGVVQEYFLRRHCRHCLNAYAPEGIELIREERGAYVVRVTCSSCAMPLGTALIGLNHPVAEAASSHGRCPMRSIPRDWNKRDERRLAGKPPITSDDVISAHQFFKSLGGDWSRYLPKVRIGSPRT